jgi:hypothetical protein
MKTARLWRNPARNLFVDVVILAVSPSGNHRVREIATGRVYWTPELVIPTAT